MDDQNSKYSAVNPSVIFIFRFSMVHAYKF